jgi:ATP-binding cassette subfamily C protein LapB
MRRSLTRISPLTLPCVLLLEGRDACVLVEWLPGERARIVLPETGGGALEMTRAELAPNCAGGSSSRT